ncbi:MAG: GNAT family N-acetyltransferase [Methylotenera sp.]|nr:GNAT family N-acetyltransferase [Methylotenera sp.]
MPATLIYMPSPLNQVIITQVTWHQAEHHLREIRTKVFIDEQHVPIDLEWDNLDETAQHLLVMNHSNEPIACARLLADGSIGRMAVLKAWRGLGVGTALLKAAIASHQQQDILGITLSAQAHAIPFYKKAGFEVISESYLDAGILHVDMRFFLS